MPTRAGRKREQAGCRKVAQADIVFELWQAVKARQGENRMGRDDKGSFVLALDMGLVDILMATSPHTFWQTPAVRYDSPDGELVREMIKRAHARAIAMKPPRKHARARRPG